MAGAFVKGVSWRSSDMLSRLTACLDPRTQMRSQSDSPAQTDVKGTEDQRSRPYNLLLACANLVNVSSDDREPR